MQLMEKASSIYFVEPLKHFQKANLTENGTQTVDDKKLYKNKVSRFRHGAMHAFRSLKIF